MAVCISIAWRYEFIYFDKVEKDCPKCIDLSGDIKGCHEELRICFKQQDRLYDLMGADKSVIARSLSVCVDRYLYSQGLNEAMGVELGNCRQSVLSCNDALDQCEAEFSKK